MVEAAGLPASGVGRLAFGAPQQGDLVAGLALAVTGVGAAAAADLPEGLVATPSDGHVGRWSGAFAPPSGWVVLCSQDCDIVRDEGQEPTIDVALVGFVEAPEAAKYRSSRYHGRYFALPPAVVPNVPAGREALVDLAWRTSVLKVSLEDETVGFHRGLSEPQRREFARWLSYRDSRAAFPDDLVQGVLDPCDDLIRRRERSAARKAVGNRNDVERVVTAVTAWYVTQRETEVFLTGVISAESLLRAGYDEAAVNAAAPFDAAGNAKTPSGAVEAGRAKLHTDVLNKLAQADPTGYEVNVNLLDLRFVSAAEFVRLRLLVR